MRSKKIIFVVLDGVGIGASPDAKFYGDEQANTLDNCARAVGGLHLPNLGALGLGNIGAIQGVQPSNYATGCFGKMAARSRGKDSTTGHWEIAGLITEKAFPVYPSGFPAEVLSKFLEVTGCKGYLGNKPASGTEIINELGVEHLRTGFPIIYTSGDSVFQIAAHEDVIPLPHLYEICQQTRVHVTIGDHRVGRVIARPFIGEDGSFVRTANRKDFSLDPTSPTMLDVLHENDVQTIGIGKIDDLFNGRGLQEKVHTKSNAEGIEAIIDRSQSATQSLVMANLVDFDMVYGHRQDVKGFVQALEVFDVALPRIVECLNDGDLLLLTADHGNDPTDTSTDHTREYVPLLTYSRNGKRHIDLGTRETFADAGKTVVNFFGLEANHLFGTSFLKMLF